MKNNLLKLSALLMFAMIFALSACNKDDADSQSAEDAARGSYIMADAFAIANDGHGGGKSLKGFSAECYEIVPFPDGGGFDIIFTQCVGDDGVYRDGTLRVTAADSAWTDENSGGISIMFIDFTHNEHGISGTVTAVIGIGDILGVGINYIYFTLGADNLRVTYPNGNTAILNYAKINYVLKLTGVEIFGNSNGINRIGIAYSTISENIKYGTFNDPCPWPTEGTITITIEGENNIIVDFDQDGTGACDNIFLVTQDKHNDVSLTFD